MEEAKKKEKMREGNYTEQRNREDTRKDEKTETQRRHRTQTKKTESKKTQRRHREVIEQVFDLNRSLSTDLGMIKFFGVRTELS